MLQDSRLRIRRGSRCLQFFQIVQKVHEAWRFTRLAAASSLHQQDSDVFEQRDGTWKAVVFKGRGHGGKAHSVQLSRENLMGSHGKTHS